MTRRRWVWGVWGASAALLVAWIALEIARRQPTDLFENVFVTVVVVLFATVGALITSRQTGNRVGLLFLWVGAIAALSGATGAYATIALERGLPLVAWAACASRATFGAMLGALAFLFLIFPTGSVPSARWRWLLRLMLAAYGVNLVAFALTPGRIDAGFAELEGYVANPLGLPLAWRDGVQAITEVAGIVVFVGSLVSVLSLFQRYRRSGRDERQQIRWLAVLGAILASFGIVTFPLIGLGVIPDEGVLSGVTFFVFLFGVFIGIPVTNAIAILRYHLYDLDVVIRKAVLYGILVMLLVIAGVVLVWITTGLLASISGDQLDLVAGVLIGLLVWPLRRVAGRIADRLIYGGRTSPYQAMTTFSHRIGETYSSEDVLERMAGLVAETTRASRATVWIRSGDEYVPAATWGEGPSLDRADARGDDLSMLPGDRAVPVRHQGELLGAVSVTMRANDPLDPARERLVDDLASQAGAVMRNVRLIEDLRESRRRIVSAQDERARKLERDLHDGAQQQLVALAVKTRLAQQLVERDPAAARTLLDQLQVDANDTLETLRDLARGIYPPLLADRGLPAALEAQARKSVVPASVESNEVGRYHQEVESAVYFSCLEALNNVAKYADASAVTISLEQANGSLSFVVADDGRGFDSATTTRGTGLQGIADRLDAIGGTLEIESTPGGGTRVGGSIPVGATR